MAVRPCRTRAQIEALETLCGDALALDSLLRNGRISLPDRSWLAGTFLPADLRACWVRMCVLRALRLHVAVSDDVTYGEARVAVRTALAADECQTDAYSARLAGTAVFVASLNGAAADVARFASCSIAVRDGRVDSETRAKECEWQIEAALAMLDQRIGMMAGGGATATVPPSCVG